MPLLQAWTCTECQIKCEQWTDNAALCALPSNMSWTVGTYYCCRCTAKCNTSFDFNSIGCGHCKARNSYEEGQRDAGWAGLRLAALCIGVGAYSELSELENPVRDAEALFAAINNCPDCRAAIVRDPDSKITILEHLKKFLSDLAALPADKLPEVVVLSLGGHGMQHGPKVFLIPAKAKSDDTDQCLSHTKVLKCLRDELDAHAEKACDVGCKSNRIKFALIMDVCRDPGAFTLTDTISEPDQQKAPGCWSLCYSTSRGSVAADGARGSHSPLVLGLLDPESGIFAPGVSLKEGIEHACEVVRAQSGVNTRQHPTDMKLRLLGNCTLKPAAANSILHPTGDDMHCSQLFEFLTSNDLGQIAQKICDKLQMHTTNNLFYLQQSEIDGLELQPWQLKKLSELVNRVKETAEHAERSDSKSLQTLFKSDKARVCVDFHSVERSQAIHLQAEEILDGQVLREAKDFADLISPVFRVVLQGASGGKVPDGQTVDLVVELVDVKDNLNTDSLVFIKKSEEPEGMWCGVSGGTFDLVPSERGKGLVLRGTVATDSFSWYGVACCHVKMAAHHIQTGQNRRLHFILYSGEPKGSYPVPRNLKDLTSFQGTHAPKLCGFFMFHRSQGPIVLKHGVEFTIQVESKGEGSDVVVKEGTLEWIHESSHIVWKMCDIDVQDINPQSKLTVKISRKNTAWETLCTGSFSREYTLHTNYLPAEVETDVTSLEYWPDLAQYQGPRKAITCGYCLSSNDAQESEEVNVVGVAGKLLLGGCCKRIKRGLMGMAPTVMTDEDLNATPARDRRPLPRIAGFLCKKTVDKKDLLCKIKACANVAQAEKEVAEVVEDISPHKEAQELMKRLQRRPIFEVDVHAQPSFKDFSDSLLSAREKNVRMLLLSGHGKSHCGFLWLKDESSATEYEEIEPDAFVKLFSPAAAGTAGGTIECVVLNACETEDIGQKLRKAGVPYVVCWRSEVDDTTATNFAVDFFTALDQSDVTKKMDYKLAFQQAVARMKELVRGSRGQNRGIVNPIFGPIEKHLAAGAVDYVCLLSPSPDDDEFPDTGYIRMVYNASLD